LKKIQPERRAELIEAARLLLSLGVVWLQKRGKVY
jgi:hypothetical protein